MGRTCGMYGGEEDLHRGIWWEDVSYRLEDQGIDGRLRGRLIWLNFVAGSSGYGDFLFTGGVTVSLSRTVLQELHEEGKWYRSGCNPSSSDSHVLRFITSRFGKGRG
jgi:hypothetical protein